MPLNNDANFSSPLPDSIIRSLFNYDAGIHHENIDHHPMIFRNRISQGVHTYILTCVPINPIGFHNKKNSIMVYKAATISIEVYSYSTYTSISEKRFFAVLKVVDDDDTKSILMLKEQVRKIHDMEERSYNKMLEIHSSFMDGQSKKFCVVLEQHFPGSIRAIMKNKFPQGFPEDLILSVLGSILYDLRCLHEHQILHTDINAGHIYICDKFHEIKLGFATGVYDEDDEGENTPYLPMASMSNWVAAPEVYYGNQSNYSEKADIWLVGITALELAYGGLKVSNRDALEAMIKEISLPPCKAAKMFKSCVEKLSQPFSPSSSSKSNPVNVDDNKELMLPFLSSSSTNQDCCPLFSKSFTKIAMQCLTWDPKKRPSADMLRSQQPFFRNNYRKDGQHFYNEALLNKTSASS